MTIAFTESADMITDILKENSQALYAIKDIEHPERIKQHEENNNGCIN